MGVFIKNNYTLICRLFSSNLLDLLLKRPVEEEWQTFFEVDMLYDEDYGYGNIRQVWMVVVEKT